MSGAGNDFVVIDNRRARSRRTCPPWPPVCDRQARRGGRRRAPAGAQRARRLPHALFQRRRLRGGDVRQRRALIARFAPGGRRPPASMELREPGRGLPGRGPARRAGQLPHDRPEACGMDLELEPWTAHSVGHFLNTGVPHFVVPVDGPRGWTSRGWGGPCAATPVSRPRAPTSILSVTGPATHCRAHLRARGRGRDPGLRHRFRGFGHHGLAGRRAGWRRP